MSRLFLQTIALLTPVGAFFAHPQAGVPGVVHRYSFAEGSGRVIVDEAGSAPGNLGRSAERTAGGAIRLTGDARSFLSWDRLLGQFGTSDFEVRLRLRTDRSRGVQEVLGNRSTYGHGNFFQIRVNDGLLVAEIDQDEDGTNYAGVVSRKRVDDGHWHQISVIRNGRHLQLEIDGRSDTRGESRGVANVRNDAAFRAGTSAVAEEYGGFYRGELDDIVVAVPPAKGPERGR